MDDLSIDFESRSTVNLRTTGVYRYASDPSTSIICMAWAIGENDPVLWWAGNPFPAEIVLHILAGGPLRAWNAMFERVMWSKCLANRMIPKLSVPRLDQWVCTAAEAAALALPRSLGQSAKVLGLTEQKDDGGHRLMLQMCKPRSVDEDGTIHWWDEEDPKKRDSLGAYCQQDVRVERAIKSKLRRLSPVERAFFLLDQTINDRGIRIDMPLVEKMSKLAKKGHAEANQRIRKLTQNEVRSITQVSKLTEWLQGEGVDLDNLRKETVRDLLADDTVISPTARSVLALRRDSAKTSTAKLRAMERCVSPDGRARGMLLYAGATPTSRWSGKLAQPHNYPRPEMEQEAIEKALLPLIFAGDYDGLRKTQWGVLPSISSTLRSCFVATPGHRFLVGDFAQIEARVLAWLAGQDDLVMSFAKGEPIYEPMGAYIFDLPVDQCGKGTLARYIGKRAILGCGFGMGVDKFRATAWKEGGVVLTEAQGERAVYGYRDRYYRIPDLWWSVNHAAMHAVREPSRTFTASSLTYVMRDNYLWCMLPSGRPLAYPLPAIQPRKTPWGEMRDSVTACGIDNYTHKWRRRAMYGGLLVENAVQALARDLLACAMWRLEKAGYPVVLTVHDEIVTEVPEGHGTLEDFQRIMEIHPPWAATLPISSETYEAERYKK